jgi:hypothetical protein
VNLISDNLGVISFPCDAAEERWMFRESERLDTVVQEDNMIRVQLQTDRSGAEDVIPG